MKKKLIRIMTAAIMAVLVSSISVLAVSQYYPDVTQPSPGYVFAGIAGSFEAVSKAELVNRVNEIRLEAYNEGLVNSYHPVKWSRGLERIAQIRAAEAMVLQDHDRPNGKDTTDMVIDGATGGSENLAWGVGSALGGVNAWYYFEKDEFVNKTGWGGHYRTMVSPNQGYMGIAAFTRGDETCVALVFNTPAGVTQELDAQTGMYGKCIQLIEVPASQASEYAQYNTFIEDGVHYAGAVLPKVKIKKPVGTKKAVKVKWKKVSKKNLKKIKKVQVQISQDPKFNTGVKNKYVSAKKTSYKFKKLKPKKIYYVRVRAYTKKYGVVRVSYWSGPKMVKTK